MVESRYPRYLEPLEHQGISERNEQNAPRRQSAVDGVERGTGFVGLDCARATRDREDGARGGRERLWSRAESRAKRCAVFRARRRQEALQKLAYRARSP